MKEKITVLLPIKNGEKFVKSSLIELCYSIEDEDEIIVIDDYSEDQTVKNVKELAVIDSRIRLVKNTKPGLVGALNLGLKESENRWIARADIDDKYENTRITEQRSVIAKNTVGIFTDYDFFSNEHSYLGTMPSAIEPNAVSVSLITSQRTAHPSILFKKDAVLDAGGYREIDFPAEDLSLWLRLSRLGELISVPKVLLHYRLSKESVSALKRKEAKDKTIEIQSNIGINNRDLEKLIANFEIVIELYQKFPNYNARVMLMYRDLIYASQSKVIENKLKKATKSLIYHYTFNNLFNIPNFHAVTRLKFEQISRQKARNP